MVCRPITYWDMLTHTLLYYIIDQPACLDVKPTHTHLRKTAGQSSVRSVKCSVIMEYFLGAAIYFSHCHSRVFLSFPHVLLYGKISEKLHCCPQKSLSLAMCSPKLFSTVLDLDVWADWESSWSHSVVWWGVSVCISESVIGPWKLAKEGKQPWKHIRF